jgi:hypothetical protein
MNVFKVCALVAAISSLLAAISYIGTNTPASLYALLTATWAMLAFVKD